MGNFDRGEYVRVAYYYYRQGLTQDEIGQKMKMSRVRVNRILNRCRDLGIVRINILGVADEHFDLESRLEQLYHMKDVRIAEAFTAEDIYDAVGVLAADFLAKTIQDNDVIGFSRGRTLSRIMNVLPRIDRKGVVSTQLLGGWNYGSSFAASNDIAHHFAERANAELNLMYAPVLVHYKKFKEAIWEEPSFLKTYETIKRCRVALVGVGSIGDDPIFLGSDQDARQDYLDLGSLGAVGEVCAHYFDEQGQPIVSPFDDKVISVLLPDYLRIPLRIGVAFGVKKQKAILGAVRGGYINALVTDAETAKFLLEQVEQEEAED